MVVALLAILGVDLIVIVAVGGLVLSERRGVARHKARSPERSGSRTDSSTAAEKSGGRGYGRWVCDLLIGTHGPLLLRHRVMAADVDREQTVSPEGVKRLGDDPLATTLRIGGATVEVATRREHRELLLNSWFGPARDHPPRDRGRITREVQDRRQLLSQGASERR